MTQQKMMEYTCVRGGERERECVCVELCQRWSVVFLGVPVEEEKVVGFWVFLQKNYVVSAEKNDAVFIITLTFVKQLTQTA